jgi:ribosome-associated protein
VSKSRSVRGSGDVPKERKNKSQDKREMLSLRLLGERLVALGHAELETMPLTAPLRTAVNAAKKFKRSALKRQYKYIEGLIRDLDADAIRQALDEADRPHREEVRAHHEVEQWRDGLLAGDDGLLDDLVNRFEQVDRQRIRQWVRNAKKEQDLNKPPKSARLLFKYLTELQQAPDLEHG